MMNFEKTNTTLKTTLLFFALVHTSCSRMTNDDISKYWWKYGSGFHLGDALRFDETNLKGDTIFKGEKPIAIIISCRTGFFEEYPTLKIEAIETGEIGSYHEKGIK
jgi:hypothetical protein